MNKQNDFIPTYDGVEQKQYATVSEEIINVLSANGISIAQARTIFQDIIRELECKPINLQSKDIIHGSLDNVPNCTTSFKCPECMKQSISSHFTY